MGFVAKHHGKGFRSTVIQDIFRMMALELLVQKWICIE